MEGSPRTMIRTIQERRLELKIGSLKADANKLSHERDLLRLEYLHAKAGDDPTLVENLAEQIRSLTKRFEATCEEIRRLGHERYCKEFQHDTPSETTTQPRAPGP